MALDAEITAKAVKNEILEGDCLEVMKTFPDNHFSAIVTDPPYGLHFMGKDWDKGVICVEYWKEMLRVLKPGAHLLAFGGTRTYHRQTCAIEDAGFEIRDCLMWLFGSGFPKSHNHFGIQGFGTALKPAYEPIILAMKPLDGTFAQNAEKWGVAGINIDASRIETKAKSFEDSRKEKANTIFSPFNPCDYDGSKGRWPANLLLDEEAAEQLGMPSRFFYCAKTSPKERNKGCEELPEIQINDGSIRSNVRTGQVYNGTPQPRKNHHPTVKPLSLMRWLLTLVSPPQDAYILDPFAGSGSTICAAKQCGITAIGIEQSHDYCEIARRRVEAA